MIRLARGGSKHRPFFHIRAADKRNARDGSYSEQLGYFNPIARGEEKRLVVDRERVDALVARGAKLSERVARLLKDDLLGPEEAAKRREVKRAKLAKRKAAKKAAAASAPAETGAEEAAAAPAPDGDEDEE